MANKKIIDKYTKEYGHIEKDYIQRFINLLDDKKIKTKEIKTIRKKTKNILGIRKNKLSFVIYLEPKPTPRPRMGFSGVFYVKGAKDNHKLFKRFADHIGELPLITTATKMTIDTYLPIKGMNRIDSILAELRLIRPLSKPDWDNLGKTYSDMINETLLLEDSLVVDGRTRKFYSAKPRIEITMEYQDKYDSLYNKRKVESWKVYDRLAVEETDHIE